jgi:hypothetical protein
MLQGDRLLFSSDGIYRLLPGGTKMNLLTLRALFWISVVMIVAIAVIPVMRFLLYQWDLRRKEFVYRFDDKALGIYLSRFHSV